MALVDLGRRDVIDGLQCPAGKRDKLFFDKSLKGFVLRVTEAGSRIFLLQYHSPVDGKVRKFPLGAYREITPAKARKAAEVARGQVREGIDPWLRREAENHAARAAQAARKAKAEADAFTLAVLIDDWHDRGLADRREKYRHEACRALRTNLAALLPLPARAIDGDAAIRVIDEIARDRAIPMARNTMAYASAMYGWAKKRGAVPDNPFADIPSPGRAKIRYHCLDDTEPAEVWAALAQLSPPFGPCLPVLLLTMQRRSEVTGMRWQELDLKARKWTIPQERSKNGKPHDVHLAEPVLALLQGMIRLQDSPFVFTLDGSKPIDDLSNAKRRIDAAIAAARAHASPDGEAPPVMRPWVFHDFRRTSVTILCGLGFPETVVDRMLNH